MSNVTLLEGDEIIVRNFDAFIEQLIELGEDDVAVVDNGAASFLPLCSYMVDNGVVEILKDAGHEVCIHSVVTGGSGFQDTAIGLDAMINHFPEARTFVWKNGYFGGLDVNGTAIESTKYFRENRERIAGIIEIPQMRHDTYGEDISDLLEGKLTFDQGIRSKRFGGDEAPEAEDLLATCRRGDVGGRSGMTGFTGMRPNGLQPGCRQMTAMAVPARLEAPPLSMAELKARIVKEHEVAISDDDPVLMTFTMLQLAVEEMDRVNAVHRSGMEAHVSDAAESCANAVGECLTVLRDENLESGLQMTLQRVIAQAGLVNKIMGRMWWILAAFLVLSILNWTAVLVTWTHAERISALSGN